MMRCPSLIFLPILILLSTIISNAQLNKNTRKNKTVQRDSVLVPLDQKALFVSPKKNMLTTHVDFTAGAGRVAVDDRSDLSMAATVKGLYMVTGALYVNMGIGISQLNSRPRVYPLVGKNQATIVSMPVGLGFTIGDDRAQIVNAIDFLPVYYVDHPVVKRRRSFTYGVGVDLGFHIRIRSRLHLGMMGKFQLFEPYDRDEHQSFPRFGFLGAGLLLRYD